MIRLRIIYKIIIAKILFFNMELKNIKRIANYICDIRERMIDKKYIAASKKHRKYEIDLNVSIKNNQEHIDRIKRKADIEINRIKAGADKKVRDILSLNDVLIDRKNKL